MCTFDVAGPPPQFTSTRLQLNVCLMAVVFVVLKIVVIVALFAVILLKVDKSITVLVRF
jgi:hypothetical protein